MNANAQQEMTEAQFKNGLDYARRNFAAEAGSHLWLDKKIIREQFNLDGKRVLDFGCGMGGMSLWYASHWDCFVHGVDIDGHHIAVAKAFQEEKEIFNVLFEKRNIVEDRPEEKYDFIFLNDVAEHIPLPVLEDIMRCFADVLSEDGKVLVSYPPWASPYASHLNKVIKIPWCQFLPRSVLYSLLDRNNLTIVGEEESTLKDAFEGLNHLTHVEFSKIITKANLRITYRKSHTILNRIKRLENVNINFFPFHFLVTKEFLVLERN